MNRVKKLDKKCFFFTDYVPAWFGFVFKVAHFGTFWIFVTLTPLNIEGTLGQIAISWLTIQRFASRSNAPKWQTFGWCCGTATLKKKRKATWRFIHDRPFAESFLAGQLGSSLELFGNFNSKWTCFNLIFERTFGLLTVSTILTTEAPGAVLSSSVGSLRKIVHDS